MIWKEVRCDIFGRDCYSHANVGPSGFDGERKLRNDAKKQGWKRKPGDPTRDVCPNCAKEQTL